MEHHRRLTGVLEEQLAQDIQDNAEDDEGEEPSGGDNSNASLRNLLIERNGDYLENTHVGDEVQDEN